MDITILSRALCEHEAMKLNWQPVPLQIWLRDCCRCIYCGRDLIESRGIAYCYSSEDHLLPKEKYPELRDRLENRVLSCRECNALKGRFDPNKKAQSYVRDSGTPISVEQWTEFKRLAREHISAQREEKERSFSEAKQLILAYLLNRQNVVQN